MNQYRKRIDALEQRREQRLKTPVAIAAITEDGDYAYKGRVYSEGPFRAYMERIKPDIIILDDTKISRKGCNLAKKTGGIYDNY